MSLTSQITESIFFCPLLPQLPCFLLLPEITVAGKKSNSTLKADNYFLVGVIFLLDMLPDS